MRQDGVTTKDLQDHFKISQPTVSRWLKHGNLKSNDLKELARYFNVSIDWLFDESETETFNRKVPFVGNASARTYQHGVLEADYYKPFYYKVFQKGCYCVMMDKDTMKPVIDIGSIVMVNPKEKPQHGDFVHYTIDDETGIGKLEVLGSIQMIRFEDASIDPILDDPDKENVILKVVGISPRTKIF